MASNEYSEIFKQLKELTKQKYPMTQNPADRFIPVQKRLDYKGKK